MHLQSGSEDPVFIKGWASDHPAVALKDLLKFHGDFWVGDLTFGKSPLYSNCLFLKNTRVADGRDAVCGLQGLSSF